MAGTFYGISIMLTKLAILIWFLRFSQSMKLRGFIYGAMVMVVFVQPHSDIRLAIRLPADRKTLGSHCHSRLMHRRQQDLCLQWGDEHDHRFNYSIPTYGYSLGPPTPERTKDRSGLHFYDWRIVCLPADHISLNQALTCYPAF